MKTGRWLFGFGLAFLCVLAVVILCNSMHQGVGVGGDSTIYMFSARNLTDGKGLGLITANGTFRFLPYFPPLYPLLLAGMSSLGFDMVASAGALNILFFVATVVLAGWLLKWAGAGLWYGWLAAAFMLVSPVLIPVFSWAMSEPLAIFLGLLSFVLLAKTLDAINHKQLLIISAVLAGASVVTRYSSAAFLATGFLAVLLLTGGRWRRRLRDLLLFGIPGSFPLLVWLIIDLKMTSAISSRSFLDLADVPGRLAAFFPALNKVIQFWFIPESWIHKPPYPMLFNQIMAPVAAIVTGLWVFWLGEKTRGVTRTCEQRLLKTMWLLVFFLVLYVLITAMVFLMTYPPITIGSRMYSPMHVAWILLVVVMAALTTMERRIPRLGAGLIQVMLVVFIAWWGWRSSRIVAQNREDGMGFTSIAWRTSETVSAVRSIKSDVPLITNEEMAILFLTGRASYPLAEIYLDKPLTTFHRFGDGEMDGEQDQAAFKNFGGALVLFDSIELQLEGLYGEKTHARIHSLVDGLCRFFKGEDGSIYYYPSGNGEGCLK